jgi:hypothetical protein
MESKFKRSCNNYESEGNDDIKENEEIDEIDDLIDK